MTARPVAHAQSHLAALETASSSDTTSDLSVRAGSVGPPWFVLASLRFQYPSCRSPSCSAFRIFWRFFTCFQDVRCVPGYLFGDW